jgi:hypothetical protein
MKRKLLAALPALAGLVTLVALVGGGPALGDINGCPNGGTANPQTSNRVGETATVNGNDVTYTFESLVTEGSGGVPGLIEYCVYSDTQPDSVVTVATGDDGSAWADPLQFDSFSFQRSDGNPSNIPYDGASHTMGTATWNSGVPTNYDRILLHINDAAECDALYGGNPGTCFVLPGTPLPPPTEGKPLGVAKGADASFDRTFGWDASKAVDKTTVNQVGGGTATFNYTVTVTHTSGTDGNWQVSGTITVSNPNADDVTGVGLSDSVDNGGTCSISGGDSNLTVPGNDALTRNYSCTYGSAPSPGSGTNTATATWLEQTLSPNGDHLAGGSQDGTATFDFAAVDPTAKDACVDVSDVFNNGAPDQPKKFCVGDTGDPTFSFKYSRQVTVPAHNCLSYTNTADFTTSDNGLHDATPTDNSRTVRVCGPAVTGALTIGFWKTTNGRSLVKIYCQNGSSNLGTYLAGLGGGFGPFSTAPTSCSGLDTYIYGILNGATATDMNRMLKAQMLGTALDVWFSGPGWTMTKSGSVKPPSNFLQHNNLGTFNMDTTAICPMVDNLNTGTATCKNNTPSTDAVAAGALPNSPMTMQAILAYAATNPSPFNGSTWYGSNRTKQEILKNVFDQFNNQDAFGSF